MGESDKDEEAGQEQTALEQIFTSIKDVPKYPKGFVQTAMTMLIQVEDKTEIERLLALLNIGLYVAMSQGALSIEAAEDYLYSPYTLEKLQELGVSPQAMRMVHLGTELEDIASLLPEKLAESLAEIQETALAILQTLPISGLVNQWVQTLPTVIQLENATNGKPKRMQQQKSYVTS